MSSFCLVSAAMIMIIVVRINAQPAATSNNDISAHQIQINKNKLEKQLKHHSDLIDDYFPTKEEEELLNKYRIEYPYPEDYIISMLVNPCGANGTHGGKYRSIALGYDCCMNQFGRGEYGFLKYDNGSVMTDIEVFEKRLLSSHDEVLHNIIAADEAGNEIPFEHSRRADDHTIIDEECRGLRDPYSYCLENRLKAIKSPYNPSCWDHNQTVDAMLRCYTPTGTRRSHCMQLSYAQNAFFSLCGSEFANDMHCGTYIEIHRENGSPYDAEGTVLAETRITTEYANGMYTTTIDLTYKNNDRQLLCNYQETKIREGSMVRVINDSPMCCCPSKYNRNTRKGSFFCPIKARTEDGPFADSHDILQEQLELDATRPTSPKCPSQDEKEDTIVCSMRFGEHEDFDIEVLELLSGSVKLTHTTRCENVKKSEDGFYSSKHLHGNYSSTCPLGETFESCTQASPSDTCYGSDVSFTFRGRIGKVMTVPEDNLLQGRYGVSFNDGRTVYYFSKHHLQIQIPPSNYELWFVQRNRFEKVLQKRKGFSVIWPLCTFDLINDRYFPFAQLSSNGEALDSIHG
eukprot:scaffold787_cov285-Chaetoceros_neogracile.AAC.78